MIRDKPDTPNPSLNKRQRSIQERITRQYYEMSKQASTAADIEKSNRIMQRSLSGKPISKPRTRVVRLFCRLCESPLVPVKGLTLELSDVIKTRYQCKVCLNFYNGFRKDDLRLEMDNDIVAIFTEWT
jgi:RNase P subunit RPR2